MIGHLQNLFLLSTPVARMSLTPRWVSRRKNTKQLSINTSKLKVVVKHSIHRTTFSRNPHLVEGATCFSFFAPCYGLNSSPWRHASCSKYQDFIFLLNWHVYSLPTATSSVTKNHTMDLLYLLKENFKNLLLDSLITGRKFENLLYLSSCSLS